ncbi:expressed unknown protein [Seminavis robusta]|uniref:Transmembrane protein n=1 Tax=Seminavis robusta TaxID=568900 RepID=A0A9N8EZ92_9STRA|nr:expressed unknown protein [Seminavis robusta]|eukprot:Sro2389_g325800.1 n/a (162) ;mRNA; f:2902-3387
MSYWLNEMEFEEPDTLTEGLLLSHGGGSDANGGGTKDYSMILGMQLSHVLLGDNNNNNKMVPHHDDVEWGSSSTTTSTATTTERCGFCWAGILLLVYSVILFCSVIDLILDFHIFPGVTIPILIAILLVVLVVTALYLAMPILMAVNEIYLFERRLLVVES